MIIVAAGSGRRFGGRKQHVLLAGRPVLTWAIEAARPVADGIVVVAPADELPAPQELGTANRGGEGAAGPGTVAGNKGRAVERGVDSGELAGVDAVVAGGATRSASVRAGLAAVPESASVVLVHDAARPLATTELFAAVAARVVAGADAVVPVYPVGDAVKEVAGGRVVATLDRERLRLAQTPQGFRAGVLRAAHEGEPEATDDSALAEAAGVMVVTVPGESRNVKLTELADLERAEALMASGGRAALRIGIGFDMHPFASALPGSGGPLRLGGIDVAGTPRLEGHSDGDALVHAVADALLGAAGLADLGRHFPDDDPATLGTDSCRLLVAVVEMLAGAGWRVVNVDCTVVAQSPRLEDHLSAMADRLSAVAGASIGVKAASPERLGSLGRSEGIACHAVALLTSA